MNNLATRVLDEISDDMKIDEQWMNRSSGSLSWVADKLEQSFSVSEPFSYLDTEAVAVESRIPIVRNVGLPDEQVCGLLSQFNNTSMGSAYVFDPAKKQVFSTLKMAVTGKDLGERCEQIRVFAMIQLILAEHQAAFMADPLSGEVATAASTRPRPDDKLNSFMAFATSRPRTENRFANQKLLRQAAEVCKRMGGVANDPVPIGIALEFRFTDSNTSIATLVSNFEHPTFGRGLRTFLALPFTYKTKPEAALAANALNLWEVAGNQNGDLLGAWCIHEKGGKLSPVFGNCIPNSLFAEAWMTQVVVRLGVRARNCELRSFPETPFSKTTQEVVKERVGQVLMGGDKPH